MNVGHIISRASNVKARNNPPFTIQDFYSTYPQFFETPENEKDSEEWIDVEDEIDEESNENELHEVSEYSKIEEAKNNKDIEKDEEIRPLIPIEVIEMYIELAHSSIKQSRYRKAWKHCMCLFIAHFSTLYMQSMVTGDATAVVHASQSRGLVSSKSVDGVSVSYDFSQMQDLEGFAAWKLTTYGVQLATFAKMYSKGGMYVP